jgi:hypothetical protein
MLGEVIASKLERICHQLVSGTIRETKPGRKCPTHDGMKNLENPGWIYLKAVLFVVIGITCGGLLLRDDFSLRRGLLLALTVWALCRAYYFAFYVVEKYIDPRFKFSGLCSAAIHLLGTRK